LAALEFFLRGLFSVYCAGLNFFVDNLLKFETFSSFAEYKEQSHHLNLMRSTGNLAEKLTVAYETIFTRNYFNFNYLLPAALISGQSLRADSRRQAGNWKNFCFRFTGAFSFRKNKNLSGPCEE